MLEVAPLSFKPSRLKNLSEKLMVSHYINNYGGALRRFNNITSFINNKSSDFSNFQWNGSKREELIAFNSVVLHEIYFNGLGGDGLLKETEPEIQLKKSIIDSFGSFESWRTQFIEMGKALGGGSGWVLLTWSKRLKKLVNQWAADHAHILAGGVPILALDMYEHAYHLDFGANAAAYIDAVMNNLDWQQIATRFSPELPVIKPKEIATTAIQELIQKLSQKDGIKIIDVRLPEDIRNAQEMIHNASWHNPAEVEKWSSQLSPKEEIVAYCLYGFDVSKNCVRYLKSKGYKASILEGGIVAWLAAGGKIQAK